MDWVRKNMGMIRDWLRCQLNYWLSFRRLIKNKKGLHLGCGWTRIESLVNLDLKPTKATDLLWDCRNLKPFIGSGFQCIYANAVLEHLTPKEAKSLLIQCHQVLSANGKLLITGIPDFEIIAQCFLGKRPGIVSKIFDITTVTRYLYGWAGHIDERTTEDTKKDFPQQHQSLYDAGHLNEWLKKINYGSWIIFRYYYKDEMLPVNLGLIAGNTTKVGSLSVEEVSKQVNYFAPGHIQKSLEILTRYPLKSKLLAKQQ